MLTDSHCHLNFPELYTEIDSYLNSMQVNKVDVALCVATRPDNNQQIIDIADKYQNLYASTGIHPDERLADFNLTPEFLLEFAKHPKVIAIGETGLDYFRVKDNNMSWQHERFIIHIQVANQTQLPLIIHTRDSIDDTLAFMKEYNAHAAVMHCFTENLTNAKRALDMGYYISISGIVTFKNAAIVQEVAKYIPLENMLIETDSPFLAPVPFRGKTNHPALIKHTAQFIADLRKISLETLAEATTNNFYKLFSKAKRC